MQRSRRALLKSSLALLAAPRLAFAQAGTGATAGIATQSDRTGTRLVLLGTQGGPNVNLQRAQNAQAIVVDGRIYLVDCGYGAIRNLVASGLGYAQIGSVFFTHLHDDHTSDLPALISLQWTNSRTMPTDIYGPPGTMALVSAAVAFANTNAEIRRVDEGRPTTVAAQVHGHDLAATSMPSPAFKDDRVPVSTAENTHYPDRSKAGMSHRAIAYRFQTATRSIVVSGDTAYSNNLVELARGADLFVCEAMDTAIYEQMLARAKAAADAGNPNNVARHVAETHSTSVDVGRMAAEAQVKTVVLTHLLPGSNRPEPGEFPDTAYIDGVRQRFNGEVIVGRDLMVL
jgi:ribonuclease BN (tRNA processing enzyme)